MVCRRPSILLPLLLGAMLSTQSSCRAMRGSQSTLFPPNRVIPPCTSSSFSIHRLSNSSGKALFIHGGGTGGQDHPPRKKKTTTTMTTQTPSAPPTTSSFLGSPTRTMVLLVGTIAVSYGLWDSRQRWMGLFDKKKLLDQTLEMLNHLDQQPKAISYTTYMLAMAVWEAVGLSTIPIETASGMVFGWPGFYLSASGKLLGAIVAFSLARYSSMATWIQEKLSTNEYLSLMEDSAAANPLQVAFLMKLSCFPETIKNYGSALLFPIRLWMFVAATVAHGWTFSALWTYLGVDAAKRLEVTSLPVDQTLQFLLSLALINGILVSPLAMAYWLKTLRTNSSTNRKQQETKS